MCQIFKITFRKAERKTKTHLNLNEDTTTGTVSWYILWVTENALGNIFFLLLVNSIFKWFIFLEATTGVVYPCQSLPEVHTCSRLQVSGLFSEPVEEHAIQELSYHSDTRDLPAQPSQNLHAVWWEETEFVIWRVLVWIYLLKKTIFLAQVEPNGD